MMMMTNEKFRNCASVVKVHFGSLHEISVIRIIIVVEAEWH